jgi:hypothetical protein
LKFKEAEELVIDPKKFDDQNILYVLARALIDRRANMKEGVVDDENSEEQNQEWE